MKFLRVLKNENQISGETVQQAYYPEHVSNFSIKTVFSGNRTFNIGKRQLSLYPDTFVAINKGTTYWSKVDSSVPVNTLSISFSPSFLSDFQRLQKNNHRYLLDEPFQSGEHPDFSFMETIYPFSGDMKYNILHLKEHLEEGIPNDMLINEYLHHCLINYYKVYNKEVVDKSENLNFLNSTTKVEILKRLTLAKEFIISHYNKDIELEDIAQHACLSVNHLLRTFKQAYGQSPHQYLIRVRVDRSKYLLKNTKYTINEIVEIIGFECPSSFIRLFKGLNKVTPGKYRTGN
ncbi:helix-turn-helix domain-containing protein [Daejeonella sp. JGW-45]|uniref:helix-turn-helix transcriptional regulator n=1 Tax=Daejeonella sp. JGW-45 TaxID=3034148 RepID=UPI0023EC3FDC|nr:helix-turn-helix domain-containing protein [Daejeonella sp. JGW-45]